MFCDFHTETAEFLQYPFLEYTIIKHTWKNFDQEKKLGYLQHFSKYIKPSSTTSDKRHLLVFKDWHFKSKFDDSQQTMIEVYL